MTLSICIVTHNHEDYISQCLHSIYQNINVKDFEVILVDDASIDSTVERIKKFYERTDFKLFVNQDSRSLSFNNNFAAKQSQGEYLLFLNPDIEIKPQTDLSLLIRTIKTDQQIGSIACLLKYPDNTIQESFRRFQTIPDFIRRGISGKLAENPVKLYSDKIKSETLFSVDWLLGAFILMNKSYFDEIGGFDLRYRLYYEDVDLGYRIKKNGKKNILHPGTEVFHNYHRSSAIKIFSRYRIFHLSSFIKFKLRTILKK